MTAISNFMSTVAAFGVLISLVMVLSLMFGRAAYAAPTPCGAMSDAAVVPDENRFFQNGPDSLLACVLKFHRFRTGVSDAQSYVDHCHNPTHLPDIVWQAAG